MDEPYVLEFSTPRLAVTSGTIVITPGAPFAIVLTAPSDAAVGEPSAPFTLTIVDSEGNPTPATEDFSFEMTGDAGSNASFDPSPVTVQSGTDVAGFVYIELEPGNRVITATGIGAALDFGADDHALIVHAVIDDD